MKSGATPESSVHPISKRLRTIFMGQGGIRAGWRLLLFVVVFNAVSAAFAWLIKHFLPVWSELLRSRPVDTLTPSFAIAQEVFLTACLLITVFVMARIEKRKLLGYGLKLSPGFLRRFWFGLAIGFGGVSLLVALIAASGGYSFHGLALAGADILKYGLLWALVFVFTAIFEEYSFRGYLQATLGDGIGFWPAAVLLAMGFAAMHLANPGEKWPGIAMLFCYAMLAAFTLRRTGDLWFILGVHAAWDWSHVFFYSLPIAGFKGAHPLVEASMHGPRWLTGGSVGPDGSVYAFVVLLLIALFVYRHYRHS